LASTYGKNHHAALNISLTQQKMATNSKNCTRTMLGPDAKLKRPDTSIPAMLLITPKIIVVAKKVVN
jgi:hypothetical protein